MFANAAAFNQSTINNWRPSNVIYMSYMFADAVAFNQPLSGWKDSVKKLAYMDNMFNGAINFDQDLSGWILDAIQREAAYVRVNLYSQFNIRAKPISLSYRPYEGSGTRFRSDQFTNTSGAQV
jgi:hypothetical protein